MTTTTVLPILKMDTRGRVRTPASEQEALIALFDQGGMSGSAFARKRHAKPSRPLPLRLCGKKISRQGAKYAKKIFGGSRAEARRRREDSAWGKTTLMP